MQAPALAPTAVSVAGRTPTARAGRAERTVDVSSRRSRCFRLQAKRRQTAPVETADQLEQQAEILEWLLSMGVRLGWSGTSSAGGAASSNGSLTRAQRERQLHAWLWENLQVTDLNTFWAHHPSLERCSAGDLQAGLAKLLEAGLTLQQARFVAAEEPEVLLPPAMRPAGHRVAVYRAAAWLLL